MENRCPPGGRERTVGSLAAFVILERRANPTRILGTLRKASPQTWERPRTAKFDLKMTNPSEHAMRTPSTGRSSPAEQQKPTFRLRVSIAPDDVGLLPLYDALVALPSDKARRLHVRQLLFQALVGGPAAVSMWSPPVRPIQPTAQTATAVHSSGHPQPAAGHLPRRPARTRSAALSSSLAKLLID